MPSSFPAAHSPCTASSSPAPQRSSCQSSGIRKQSYEQESATLPPLWMPAPWPRQVHICKLSPSSSACLLFLTGTICNSLDFLFNVSFLPGPSKAIPTRRQASKHSWETYPIIRICALEAFLDPVLEMRGGRRWELGSRGSRLCPDLGWEGMTPF